MSLTCSNAVTQRWRGWASYGVLADFLRTGPGLTQQTSLATASGCGSRCPTLNPMRAAEATPRSDRGRSVPAVRVTQEGGCDGGAGAVPAVVERVLGARPHRDLRGRPPSRVAPHLALLLSGSHPGMAGTKLQAHQAGAEERLPGRRSRRQRRAQRSRRCPRVDHQQAEPGAARDRAHRAAAACVAR